MTPALLVVGTRTDRFAYYRKLSPDLVVFPEIDIAKRYNPNLTVWSGSLPARIKTRWWMAVLQNREAKPILTTRSGLLLPFQQLSRIIVDDPHHPGHLEQQTPGYRADTLARRLGQLHGAQVIVGLPVLGAQEFYGIKQGHFKRTELALPQLPDIVIQQPSPLQPIPRRPALYFLAKRGTYSGTICRDCGSLQGFPPGNDCTQCRSTRLKPYGIGTQALAKQLETIYQQTVTVVDQNNPLPRFQPALGLDSARPGISDLRAQIVVATHKIFDYDLEFDTTVVSHFDHLLALPDPFQTEYIFETLSKLAQLTKKTLIIQTSHPHHPAIQHLGTPEKFYHLQLAKRRQHLLPPFRRIVKLTAPEKMPVPKFVPPAVASPVHLNSDGQFQIILRLPVGARLDALRPKLSRWKLEGDPTSLL